MLIDECVVGAHVICRHPKHLGKLGIINRVDFNHGNIYDIFYEVKDASGAMIGSGGWSNLASWDIYTGLTAAPMTGFKAVPRSKSKECPCGITRYDCDYHKDQ